MSGRVRQILVDGKPTAARMDDTHVWGAGGILTGAATTADGGHTVSAYEAAAARIAATPALEPYRAVILYDWPEGDAHYTWAATCELPELLSWAGAVVAAEDPGDLA